MWKISPVGSNPGCKYHPAIQIPFIWIIPTEKPTENLHTRSASHPSWSSNYPDCVNYVIKLYLPFALSHLWNCPLKPFSLVFYTPTVSPTVT